MNIRASLAFFNPNGKYPVPGCAVPSAADVRQLPSAMLLWTSALDLVLSVSKIVFSDK
jgi:hypothetical protein